MNAKDFKKKPFVSPRYAPSLRSPKKVSDIK